MYKLHYGYNSAFKSIPSLRCIVVYITLFLSVGVRNNLAQESQLKHPNLKYMVYEFGAALAVEGVGMTITSMIDVDPILPLVITGLGMLTAIDAIANKAGYKGSVALGIGCGIGSVGLCIIVFFKAVTTGSHNLVRLSLVLPALGMVLGYNASYSAIEPESLPHRSEILGFLLHAPTCVTHLRMSPHGTLYRQVNFNLINVSF
ncbi:hypothetical protein KAR48_17845 [bacterium]|nr:hypothetical protein [bacterium]